MHDRQLIHLATAALQEYGLENGVLTRLGGASNTNFRTAIGDTAYVLRLYTSAQHDRATIASELAWLRSLHTDTALVLPTPIVNLNGEPISCVTVDGGTHETLCTCMTWLEGHIPPTVDAMTNEQIANTGSVMAQLHQHTQRFQLPPGFTRPTFGAAHFRQRLEMLVTALIIADVDEHERNTLKVNMNHIIAYVAHMERTPDRFGLIHADFHSGNYVLYHNTVRVIDFDRCGFGFYLYDLALALIELEEQARSVFVQGYERVKPLPDGYPRLVPIFLCLAYLDNLGFLAAQAEELPFVVAELPLVVEAVQRAVAVLPTL